MEIFTDNVPAPAGMMPDEWTERKRKLRRKTWKQFLKSILIAIIVIEVCIWITGGYEELQPKKLDELQVASGTFYYGGAKRTEIGITDTTGQRLIFQDWIYYPSRSWDFKGHPSSVWYYVGQTGRRCVYQLEVDGVLDFDLEKANQNLDFRNRIKKQLTMQLHIGGLGIFTLCSWWEFRRRYRECLSQESKR